MRVNTELGKYATTYFEKASKRKDVLKEYSLKSKGIANAIRTKEPGAREVLNNALEELAAFEEWAGVSVTDFLKQEYAKTI